MTENEFLQKISYHKRMLGNLKRYLTLGIVVSGISIVLIVSQHKWIGSFLLFLSVFWVLIVGYAIYNGNRQANQLIDSFEKNMQEKNPSQS